MVLLLIRWGPAMGSWDGWGVTSQGTQIFRRLLCCSAGTDVSLFHPLGQKLLSLGGTWGKMPVGEAASTGFLVSFQLQHMHFSSSCMAAPCAGSLSHEQRWREIFLFN